MNCGPWAVARITRRPFKEVVGRFDYFCEQVTRHRKRRGGTTLNECRLVLGWYGFEITQDTTNRRITLARWARTHRTGFWLMHQPGHWFGLRGGKQIRREVKRNPNAPLSGWSRVERVK
jgi:hypothetical protein